MKPLFLRKVINWLHVFEVWNFSQSLFLFFFSRGSKDILKSHNFILFLLIGYKYLYFSAKHFISLLVHIS